MRTPPHALHRHSGMVLIISLIILLLLTIIGVSGMKVSSLEEKMAGNDRDQSVAFQAAETALRMGETQAKRLYDASNLDNLCDGTLNTTADQQGLFYNPSINDGNHCVPCPATPTADCVIPNPMSSATWANTNTNTLSAPVLAANLLPNTTARYYITYHYFYRNKGADKTMDSYYFTVTARGQGANGGEVILRSYFGAKIDMGQI